jgi:hypothetical protein
VTTSRVPPAFGRISTDVTDTEMRASSRYIS